ncbi:NYN domain-containing protein [Dictyobacter aurantiacus]|uniref:NYN domain-containing protein n=1 Tax=Dictyobacter aurantiacus TaxID=1936993 RepID=A0A401ZGD5_9CHLR|nr:NYN domain-containing protein [Dictyobacter aurantiacus]GCE05950.1 hypothetical protein KDAU_32790 [Dictyobacter aurantiacus]
MGFDILVDGYNVIKNNAMFKYVEGKSQAEARNLLIKQLKNRYRNTTDRVVVVFDGKGGREQMQHIDHICVIYSKYGETADSVIARLATEANDKGVEVMMYSDDGEVKRSVIEQGGHALTTRGLVSSLNAAPQDVLQRSEYRQEMRRVYGIDPTYKYQQDNEEFNTPSPPRKGKSSRRYKSMRVDRKTLKHK